MSKYDARDLMEIKSAAREYDVPALSLELAIQKGALRVIETSGVRRLLRSDVEQFVKRTVKRGAGNAVLSRIRK